MLSPQEKLLLNDTAKMMATLEERNILLQLQEKLNARKHMNENEIARLHDTFEATRLVCLCSRIIFFLFISALIIGIVRSVVVPPPPLTVAGSGLPSHTPPQ